MRRNTLSANHRFAFYLKYCIFLCLIVVVVRLFQIQIVNGSKYRAFARDQHNKITTINAKRGNIYFSDGKPAVTSSLVYDLWLNTKGIRNLDSYINNLKPIIEINETYVKSKFRTQQHFKIAENLTIHKSYSIEELNFRNLYLQPKFQRFYPEGNIISQVLGFVGHIDDGTSVGYFGIEQFYNGDLEGQPGMTIQKKSASGQTIIQFGKKEIKPRDGSDIYTTIDHHLQFVIEDKIKEGVRKHSAKSGDVIVINPKTGAILALASYPEFDLLEGDRSEFSNPIISEVYEPGSVMKPITIATAIDLGKVDEHTTYNDHSPVKYSDYVINNWDSKNRGIITIPEILQYSNNLGTAWVATRIGDELLLKYFKQFGFGKRLGVDLEGEEKGIFYEKDHLRDIELATAAFGQGVAVTPLQMVFAYSAFVNRGKIMKPYVVDRIMSSKGVSITEPKVLYRAVSTATAEKVKKMLGKVVDSGEVAFIASQKYRFGGKTGTAQIPVKGGYDESRTNNTFVGFFMESDNILMLVRLSEPTYPSFYSSETAVPVWMDIAEYVGSYYDIPKRDVKVDDV